MAENIASDIQNNRTKSSCDLHGEMVNGVWIFFKKWSLPSGRLFGINIRLHILVTLGIPLWFVGVAGTNHLTIGTLTFLTILFSIFIHEMSHALASKVLGSEVKGIVLVPPFAGLAFLVINPECHIKNILIYVSGPLANMLFAGILSLLYRHVVRGHSFLIDIFLQSIIDINLLLGVANLIPLFPLDGGRILRETVLLFKAGEKKANIVTLVVSSTCFLGMSALALQLSDYIDLAFLFILILYSFFLLTEKTERGQI